MKKNIIVLLLLFSKFIYAQNSIIHKELIIKRTEKAPKIDGVLDDLIWQKTNIATNFVMLEPIKGKKEPNNIKTEVRIVYDDEAIYFGAYLYDDKPNEIPMEIQTRDNFGNADYFSIKINPLNDGINQTVFMVTSIGNQNDAKSSGYNDWSWNAVWESSVKLVDNGWIVEIKIPYAALRFSNDKNQTWGINFHRFHKKTKEEYTWNEIDIENGKASEYDGVLKGINNIKPPVRLSFNPFIFGAKSFSKSNNEFDWSAGLDLKYGINENFTLDATLIPDFGQVQFDDITLDLGPFEQLYSEQRSFFTEGTDLFSKGNLFNSRRIGGSPSSSFNTSNNEIILENPSKIDVLNIIKISGRTKKGLGIGVLNAITKKTEAIIKNKNTNKIHKIVTEPLANYNVFVLDKQFNKNSSISLVNTNVIRNGDFRDANVTSLLFNLNKKDNSYGISGGISNANIFKNEKNISGLQGDIQVGKRSGKNRFSAVLNIMDDKYDKNDLGYQRRNNYISISGRYSYHQFKPKGIFNRFALYTWASLGYLYKMNKSTLSYSARSKKYTGSNIGANFYGNTKKHYSFGINFNSGIGKTYDYYEALTQGRFYVTNSNFNSNIWFSSNESKDFSYNIYTYAGFTYGGPNKWIGVGFKPRYRFNDKFSIIYGFNYGIDKGEIGLVDFDNNNIIFGERDTFDIENTLSGKYNFTTKAALSLSFRHYWKPVTYKHQYFDLNYDGTLSDNTYVNDNDINFNTWNVDLNFKWEFAPGSELIALYRNNLFKQDNQDQLNFNDNLSNLFKEEMYNNVSIKLIYYLDYNKLTHLF